MEDEFLQRITFTATVTVHRRGLNWKSATDEVGRVLDLASESVHGDGELALVRVTALESLDGQEA